MTDSSGNLFMVLCDKSLSKEDRTIRTWLNDSVSGQFSTKTIRQVPQVINYEQFPDQLKQLLTTWSEAVIVLTSANFASYINEGNTNESLPDLLKKNHPQSHKVLKEFFINDSKQERSKIIAITVNGDATLPQCLSHVQPLIKDEGKDVFFEKIQELVRKIYNP